MQLIITEKNNSAKKIAEHLAAVAGTKPLSNKSYGIPYYNWSDDQGDKCAIGLKGHVMTTAFPEQYSDWRKVEPVELVDAKLIKEPTQKSVVKAVKKEAKSASSIIIATDYDREGELIGLEALDEALEVNPELKDTVKRARYSALTRTEIENSFNNLVELSMPLAKAGEARQDIDLIWGATLTRFISLATGRLGNQFLSVGRVQSPTLALVVDRELERRAHKPEPYWELFAAFEHPDGEVVAHHATDKFWKEEEANAALKATESPGLVTKVEAKSKTRRPPAPFNTTSFTSAAAAVGITPARAMRVAESLYMDGSISYPRTDNTVYPDSLPVRSLIKSLSQLPAFSAAEQIAKKEKLSPTRGKKQTTDHPPIYPTQAVDPNSFTDSDKRKIYELVASRFLATFADPSVSESTRVDIEAGTEGYFVRGTRLVKPGFLAVYPYSRRADEEIPKFDEGQKLNFAKDPWLDAKETKPPPRIGQGKLIEMMEERGLGTKATRHTIIQGLYVRGYIHGNPAEPTETGIAMVKALDEFAQRIATPDMTAELEDDMDSIAGGDRSKEQVVDRSREILHVVYKGLEENKKKLAETIWAGMNQDRILGPCYKCQEAGRKDEDGAPNMLRIIRAKKSGKRFVGCQGYPECDQTYGIPQRGELIGFEEVCTICSKAPRLKVTGGRRAWNLCLNDECPSMEEMRAKREARAKAAAEKKKTSGAKKGKKTKAKKKSESADSGDQPEATEIGAKS